MNAVKVSSACSNAWAALDFSLCKPFGLDASTWIAGLTALAGILFFVVRQCVRLIGVSKRDGNYVSATFGRSRFRNLCRAIEPLMDENYRIFSRFGPNSGEGDGLPKNVRSQLGVWYQLRGEIVENNARLRDLITTNFEAINQQHRPMFLQWLDHIDAFRAHVADPSADYREHQFGAYIPA